MRNDVGAESAAVKAPKHVVGKYDYNKFRFINPGDGKLKAQVCLGLHIFLFIFNHKKFFGHLFENVFFFFFF